MYPTNRRLLHQRWTLPTVVRAVQVLHTKCDVSTLYDTSQGQYLGHTANFIHSLRAVHTGPGSTARGHWSAERNSPVNRTAAQAPDQCCLGLCAPEAQQDIGYLLCDPSILRWTQASSGI
jgi:hypothetical protein